MTPYIVTFIISTLALWLSEKARETTLRLPLRTIAVLSVASLAGMREWTVGGPDALKYGDPIFQSSLGSASISQAISNAQEVGAKGELGYVLVNYAVSRFTDSFPFLLFVLAIITNTIILCAILIARRFGSPILMWITYLFTTYATTFNLLRQSVALALTVLGVSLLLARRRKLSFVIGLSGVAFHTSAMLFLVVYFIALMADHYSTKTGKHALRVIVAALMVTGIAFYCAIRLSSQYLSDEYGSYLESDQNQQGSLGVNVLYRTIPIIVGLIAARVARKAATDSTSVDENPIVLQNDTPSTTPTLIKFAKPNDPPLADHDNRTEQKTSRTLETSRYCATVVLLALLAVDLVYVSLRTLNATLGRIVMYFSWAKVIAYSVFLEPLEFPRALNTVMITAFCYAYFYWIFIANGVAVYTFGDGFWLRF